MLTRVKELKQSMMAYDMDDVFKIPFSFKEDLPSEACEAVDLFKESGSVTLDIVRKGKKFYYLYGKDIMRRILNGQAKKYLILVTATLRIKYWKKHKSLKHQRREDQSILKS